MHPSIDAFIDHLQTERQASSHTVRSYEDDLELYSGYLAEVQGDGADPSAVDPARLRRYSAWLAEPGLCPEHRSHDGWRACVRSSGSCDARGW